MVASDDGAPDATLVPKALSTVPFAPAVPHYVAAASFVPNSDGVAGVLTPKPGVDGPLNKLLVVDAAFKPGKTD